MPAIDRGEIENFKIKLIARGIPNGDQSVCFDIQAALFSRVRWILFPTQDGPLEDVVSLLPLNSVSKLRKIAGRRSNRTVDKPGKIIQKKQAIVCEEEAMLI